MPISNDLYRSVESTVTHTGALDNLSVEHCALFFVSVQHPFCTTRSLGEYSLYTDTYSRANSNTPVYFARTSNKGRRSRLHYTSRSCCRTLFTPFRRLVQHAASSSVLTAVRIKFKFALSTTVAQKVKEYYFIACTPHFTEIVC